MKCAVRLFPENHVLLNLLVCIFIRLGDTSSRFWICEIADCYERCISLDTLYNTSCGSKPLLKVLILPGNCSFNAVSVSFNFFRPRQMVVALQDSVPYVTSKIALEGNRGLELDKSDDALCLLNERRHAEFSCQ
jgi:hypothetical protein